MFKGSIVDPEVLRYWYWNTPMPSGNIPTWQTALRPLSETLTNTAPLIFTGLAVAIPFRAGLFNIGGQGQAIMGAVVEEKETRSQEEEKEEGRKTQARF